MGGLEEDFAAAAEDISNNVNKTLSDDELKEVYALYKQGTVGDVNTSRPGMLDFKGKAKWDAWNGKKGMEQMDAKEKYVAFAAQLKEKHGVTEYLVLTAEMSDAAVNAAPEVAAS